MIHRKGSRFSISEENDHIVVHDGDRRLILEQEDEERPAAARSVEDLGLDMARNYDDGDDDDGNNDIERGSMASVESYTLRERQDAINKTHPFGIRIWKPALYKKIRSVQQAADEDIHETKIRKITFWVQLTNAMWSCTVGMFLYLLLSFASILVLILGLFTSSAFEYALVFYRLGRYLLWPFGKIVSMVSDAHYLIEDQDEGISAQQFYNWITTYSNKLFFHESQAIDENTPTDQRLQNSSYGSIQSNIGTEEAPDVEQNDEEAIHLHRRLFGRGQWSLGRIVFYFVFHILIQPVVMLLALVTWILVFTIPMSNIMWNLMYHCRRHPLALDVVDVNRATSGDATLPVKEMKGKNILLCTFRCAGWHYYKFTVDGTNVIVMNLITLVIFTVFDFYAIKGIWNVDAWFTNESTIFMLCLLSIVPLAFYIGQAVASISAQSSMGLAAVINAFFSTIVEIFLYCVALQQKKGTLVEGSLIGSILAAVLLLPGMSMCGGAIKRKTQRYNPASAGVSCAMLVFSMMVMFIPTILYEIYGEWDMNCDKAGEKCHFMQPQLQSDKMYTKVLKPIVIFCAIALFFQYTIGLWFTLRTHAKLIWELPIGETKDVIPDQNQLSSTLSMSQNSFAQVNNQKSNNANTNQPKLNDNGNQDSGHDAPNWSRTKSTCILLGATFLYAVIAEILVDCVDHVLDQYPSINPKFLGLTIFALIPNTTEFLNAISFAMNGNVALSMEIGSAYALQVCLLQIPALVIFSMIYVMKKDISKINIRDEMFPMVFPRWDLIASVLSVVLFTYLYAEGKSNYFKGSMLILLYMVLMFGFYFQGVIDDDFWEGNLLGLFHTY